MSRTRPFRPLTLLPLALLLVSGCASAPPSSTAARTWEELLSRRETFEGARGLSEVTLIQQQRRRLDVTFLLDPRGRLELSVISPFGTRVGTIFLESGELVVVNRAARLYWEGRVDELGEILPLGGLQVEGIGFLLVGLPPEVSGWTTSVPAEGFLEARRGDRRLLIHPDGIASADIGNPHTVKARLSLPSNPPTRISILDPEDSETAVVQHDQIEFAPVVVERPAIEDGFRRTANWLEVIASR